MNKELLSDCLDCCALVNMLMYTAKVLARYCDEAERAQFYSAFEWDPNLTLPEYRKLFEAFIADHLDELCSELAGVDPEGLSGYKKLEAVNHWALESLLSNSELAEAIAEFAIDHR